MPPGIDHVVRLDRRAACQHAGREGAAVDTYLGDLVRGHPVEKRGPELEPVLRVPRQRFDDLRNRHVDPVHDHPFFSNNPRVPMRLFSSLTVFFLRLLG